MKINRFGKPSSAGLALIAYLFLLILVSTHSHELKWQENQLYEGIGNSIADNLLLVDGTCIFQFNGLFSYYRSDENTKYRVITPKSGNNRIIRLIPHKNIFTSSVICLTGPPRFLICCI